MQHHLTSVLNHQTQKIIFGRREVNFCAMYIYSAPFEVNVEVVEGKLSQIARLR